MENQAASLGGGDRHFHVLGDQQNTDGGRFVAVRAGESAAAGLGLIGGKLYTSGLAVLKEEEQVGGVYAADGGAD